MALGEVPDEESASMGTPMVHWSWANSQVRRPKSSAWERDR